MFLELYSKFQHNIFLIKDVRKEREQRNSHDNNYRRDKHGGGLEEITESRVDAADNGKLDYVEEYGVLAVPRKRSNLLL